MTRMTLPAWLSAMVPIIAQMRHYRAEWMGRDITAGFAIAAVALPIGVAYPASPDCRRWSAFMLAFCR